MHLEFGMPVAGRCFEVTEDDPGTVVRSRNASRRHQSTGQLAMSTGMSLVLDGKRRDGRWVGWSRTSQNLGKSAEGEAMRRVGFVLDHAPDLAVPVRDGDQALDSAYQEATDRRDAERNRLAEAERLAAVERDARTFVEELDGQGAGLGRVLAHVEDRGCHGACRPPPTTCDLPSAVVM